jgi:hypothetical protein
LSSILSRLFSADNSWMRRDITASFARRFSLERLAASLFFCRFSQYSSSFFDSGMNSRIRRVIAGGVMLSAPITMAPRPPPYSLADEPPLDELFRTSPLPKSLPAAAVDAAE